MNPNMRVKQCCVPGCKDTLARRFSIPADERIRNVWLDRIQNPKFDTSRDRNFFRSYNVCGQHFHDMCLDPTSGFLLRYSVPTLGLSAYNQPSTPENCFSRPLDPFQPRRTPERVRKVLAQVANAFSMGASSTPSKETAVMPGITMEVRTSSTSHSSAMLECPSDTPGVTISPRPAPTQSPSASAAVAPRRKRGLLQVAGVTRRSMLSPEAAKLYARAKRLNKLAAGRSARKLKRLQKCGKTLDGLKNVNRTTLNSTLPTLVQLM